jgi:N-methylhydantoinase A/oxoprolinase/acetone carboxylase beta subunit
VYFDGLGRVDTPLYPLEALAGGGARIEGPAILLDRNSTIVALAGMVIVGWFLIARRRRTRTG